MWEGGEMRISTGVARFLAATVYLPEMPVFLSVKSSFTQNIYGIYKETVCRISTVDLKPICQKQMAPLICMLLQDAGEPVSYQRLRLSEGVDETFMCVRLHRLYRWFNGLIVCFIN